jgi:uncharacterized protein (DUF2267 family)
MPQSGLAQFDTTVQETNEWLQEIISEFHPDRQIAYHALRGVLHALRDRLPPDETMDFAAQLPTLVRGIFFEGYGLHNKPIKYNREEFLHQVFEELDMAGGGDPEDATRAVFRVISDHISEGEVRHVRELLPHDFRDLWPRE